MADLMTRPNGPLGSCEFDANGTTSTTPLLPGYPFPNRRPLSLVLRVGTETFQGGTDVTFTTHQVQPLEICANDYNMSDNTGVWGIMIDVDESAAQ